MSDQKRHELIIGGTGGQGVITIGYALAAAAAETYAYVTRFPIYMATMRGGPAFCTVIFSDQEIAAPILSRTDNAIAMEGGAYLKLRKETKPGGHLVVNSSIIKKIEPAQDFSIHEVPVTDLAQEIGRPQMANVVMLGAYRQITGVMSDERVLAAVQKDFAGESQGRLDAIQEAYLKGAAFVRDQK